VLQDVQTEQNVEAIILSMRVSMAACLRVLAVNRRVVARSRHSGRPEANRVTDCDRN
jgi:hypothetical protein